MLGWKSFDFASELKQYSLTSERNLPYMYSDNDNYIDRDLNYSSFYKKMVPKSIDDLAVHSKKVKEVEEWLILNVVNSDKQLKFQCLLISGPTGSGKTTCLKLLCEKMRISISEWINSLDQDYISFKGISQINRFQEFLMDSKWKSLCEEASKKQITLVKDFPNAAIHRPEEFTNILLECFDKLKCPVIFICTETSNNSLNLKRTLFTDDIIQSCKIAHISFNSCASYLMKRAIKRAQLIIQENPNLYHVPPPAVVDVILATSLGDIRNLMNQFYFACLLGINSFPANKKMLKVNKGNYKTSFGDMSRNESLGLFHGLGKVLNPKRKQYANSWRLNCDIENLVEEFSIQPFMFISFLFENYLKYFGSINDASNAAQILSVIVCCLDNLYEKPDTNFTLWISVLGFMIFNEHKISKWNQIRSPVTVIDCYHRTSRNHSTYEFYYNIIKATGSHNTFIP